MGVCCNQTTVKHAGALTLAQGKKEISDRVTRENKENREPVG